MIAPSPIGMRSIASQGGEGHAYSKQILGLQFYRQKPVLNFIVDFYCPSANLVIECDGSQHYTAEGLEADWVREGGVL